MIWRVLFFWSWLVVVTYAHKHYGAEVAVVASSLVMIVLLPLSMIERRLVELIKVAKS